MLDAIFDHDEACNMPNVAAPAARNACRGPERRSVRSLFTRWMALMLDEVDYGMQLLADAAQVLHVNHAARAELDAGHPLQLLGRELSVRHPQDVARLHDPQAGAQRGVRKLVTMGAPDLRLRRAVIPPGTLGNGGPRATLLVMGKRQVCERLSVQWFARSHALTTAETRVLEAMCSGLDPREVAEQHQVGLATVCTQIGSIRSKTGAESIRDLVRQVSVLPPMVSSLRVAA